jgi:hypothetical protein
MAITSESKCLLMGLDGVTYHAQLADISTSGALITMSADVPHGLHVGEMCGFIIRESPNIPSTKHTGIIVALDSGIVEISFRHQEHTHQKKKFTPT